MPQNKDFPYTVEIRGSIRSATSDQLAKMGLSKASMISNASTLIPQTFDSEKNIDVLPVVFNLAVVNKFNANDDGINSKVAAAIVKQFIHKPINIEHYKDRIVGHIINASFSDKQPDFMENDPMDFIDREDPFYITAAGLIYRHVYPELADALIKASMDLVEDKEEVVHEIEEYGEIFSTSWEVGFSEFDVAVGGDRLDECEVYSNGSADYEEYKAKLKAFKGSGNSSEGRVCRLIKGKTYPLGAAITFNPAADVEGIFTLSSLFSDETEEKEHIEGKKENPNISLSSETDVKIKKFKDFFNMTDEQFTKLMERLEKAVASAPTEEAQASTVLTEISDVLKSAGTEWKSKAETSLAAAETAKAELSTLKEDFDKANQELASIKADLEAKASADLFNSRVKAITERFELSDAEEAIVIEDVKALSTEDSAFDAYQAKAAVLFADKDKETKEAREQARQEAVDAEAAKLLEAQASKNDETSEELETEEESQASVPNNNGDQANEETLLDRIKKNGLEIA